MKSNRNWLKYLIILWSIFSKIFLHHFSTIIHQNVKTTYYGLSSIKHLAPQIWELVPQSLRKWKTLNQLKTRLNPGIQIIVRESSSKSIQRNCFHLKRIQTSSYDRTRLYACNQIIFIVWCNCVALVSFAVVTIIFYLYLFNLYLYLLTYLFDLSHL